MLATRALGAARQRRPHGLLAQVPPQVPHEALQHTWLLSSQPTKHCLWPRATCAVAHGAACRLSTRAVMRVLPVLCIPPLAVFPASAPPRMHTTSAGDSQLRLARRIAGMQHWRGPPGRLEQPSAAAAAHPTSRVAADLVSWVQSAGHGVRAIGCVERTEVRGPGGRTLPRAEGDARLSLLTALPKRSSTLTVPAFPKKRVRKKLPRVSCKKESFTPKLPRTVLCKKREV